MLKLLKITVLGISLFASVSAVAGFQCTCPGECGWFSCDCPCNIYTYEYGYQDYDC